MSSGIGYHTPCFSLDSASGPKIPIRLTAKCALIGKKVHFFIAFGLVYVCSYTNLACFSVSNQAQNNWFFALPTKKPSHLCSIFLLTIIMRREF